MGIRRNHSFCDASWNPVLGCSPVSPGCSNCGASNAVHRFSKHPDQRISVPMAGLTTPENRGTWTGEAHTVPGKLREPLSWEKPRRVAVAPLGDLFHDSVHDEFLVFVFRTMLQAHWHTYFICTKRPRRLAEFSRKLCFDEKRHDLYLATAGGRPWLPLAPHVFAGTSVEDQERADERMGELLRVEAASRWIAVEPILAEVDLNRSWKLAIDSGAREPNGWHPGVKFVLAGGEVGPSARPFDVRWVEALRGQCRAANLPFYFRGGERPARGSVLLEAVPDELLKARELPTEAKDGTQV